MIHRVSRMTFGVVLAGLLMPAMVCAQERNWYLQIKAGVTDAEAQWEISSDQGPAWYSGDSGSLFLAAGRKLNDYFSVQAAYHDFGDFDGQVSSCGTNGCIIEPTIFEYPAEISGLSVTLRGSWPAQSALRLHAEFGWLHWYLKPAFVENPNPFVSSSVHIRNGGDAVLRGVGVSYRLSDAWSLALEFQEFGFGTETQTQALSLTWHF